MTPAPRSTLDRAPDGQEFPRASKREWALPFAVFGSVELVAAVAIPYIARHMWFYHDEWDFLADRTGGNLGDLFRPHNEHWSTLPILAYRGLWQLFGLRHYAPYLMLDVLLHLMVGALLLVILKRCGVRPWLSVSAALMFVLFGSGYQDIAHAFQIGFVGSLVFGFAQLLFADHQGALDRRDWLGLAAGAAGLLCSGIAVPMVVIVGVAAFLRRGLRVALFHTLPLGLVYVLWYAVIGHEGISSVRVSVGGILRFSYTGLVAEFRSLGQVPGVGVMLVVALVVGSVRAWRGPLRPGRVPASTAVPIACLVGLVAFLVISATGRDAALGASYARVSRYLHIEAAFLIVPLGVAAEALVRHRRLLLVPAIGVFLIGIPGNIATFVRYEHRITFSEGLDRQEVLWAPRVGGVRRLSPTTRSTLTIQEFLPLHWLLAASAQGKVPSPDAGDINARDTVERIIDKAALADAIANSCQGTQCVHPAKRP